MYAPPSGRHLGETVLTDPLVEDPLVYFTNEDGIALTPNTVSTPGGGGGGGGSLPAPSFAPESIDSTNVPQTLPPLVTTAPPSSQPAPNAGPNIGTILLLVGVALFATDTLLKPKRRRR